MSDVPQPTALAPSEAGLSTVAAVFSPLYLQIKAQLTRSLQSGQWKPGESIPSEMELAALFKVSQGTVRKAIDELATENLLVRRQGKGTFVATHAEERTQYRFLRLTADDGQAHRLQRRLLDCRRERPVAEMARALEMKGSESVVRVRRLLLQQDEPVVLDHIYLPGAMFKGLNAELLNHHVGPMYRLFETEFGVRMIRAEEKIRAVAADGTQAKLLEVSVGSPLLLVERLSFTYGDRPVELRRGYYRTDRYHYRNELM